MDLAVILNKLKEIAHEKRYSEPFIVGGIPRDFLMDEKENIEDVDISTGSSDIHALAKDFGAWAVENGGDYRVLKDGHAQVQISGFKIDFSSNFIVPNIKEILAKVGVKNPNNILMEQLSRDFTCNSLTLSLNLKTIKDPTGLGINDIKKERIRTCLPAAITFKDHKRIVRVLYLAAKLGFSVDGEIIDWIKKNPGKIVEDVAPKYLSQKLQKACDYDLDNTVKLINEMGLWTYIPILEDLMPYSSRGLVNA
jgi:tRNA nucleotidyltransferase/poly(A) polymerase